jgi:uncharacterized UPF0160 family protein
MSSAGLVFKYFHEKLFEKYGLLKTSRIFNDIKIKIYEEMFLSADAIDNGVDIFGEIKPRTISAVVGSFNLHDTKSSTQDKDARFYEALSFVRKDLQNYLNYVMLDYAVNYDALFDKLEDFDEDIFVTEKIASIDLIFDVNERLGKDIKYVIYPDDMNTRIYLKKGNLQ